MSIKRRFMLFTSHVYLHKYPLWIVYKPTIHPIKNSEIEYIRRMTMFGDILLRRFNGYLNTICTSKFFNSFWGHAAIYAGDNRVIHAVSDGVVYENFNDFCRADAISVLQRKDYTEEIAASVVSKAMEFEVKDVKYDFDFISGNLSYYCTEFVNVTNDSLFDDDYSVHFNKRILTPDNIRYSNTVRLKLEVNGPKTK